MIPLVPAADYDDVLDPYRVVARPPRPERPWVLANMVCGLDGSTAVSGRVGPLSGDLDARLFLRLRSLADVTMVGASTVRNERYGPVRLDPELEARRVAAGRPPRPAVAVVSGSLDLDWCSPLFDSMEQPRPIVITSSAAPAHALEIASLHADVIVAGIDRVDLGQALGKLRQRGCEVVLCEGGATLLGQLIAGHLLDELCLTLSPMMGGDSLPVAVTPPGSRLERFRLEHVGCDGDGAVFLRYEIDDRVR